MDPAVVQAGDRVLVTGPGPVGLLAAQLAKAMGGEVVVSGLPKDAERLAAASALGLEATSDALAAESADVVIDCSGSGSGAAVCLRSARRGGRYVQIGLFGKDPVIPFDLVVYRELVVTSGFASTPKSWRRAMAVMASGVVQLDPLVTRVEPLEAWRDVFGDMREGRGLKPVLDPRL
jgi:L-iditol 2-dehydrogenase